MIRSFRLLKDMFHLPIGVHRLPRKNSFIVAQSYWGTRAADKYLGTIKFDAGLDTLERESLRRLYESWMQVARLDYYRCTDGNIIIRADGKLIYQSRRKYTLDKAIEVGDDCVAQLETIRKDRWCSST